MVEPDKTQMTIQCHAEKVRFVCQTTKAREDESEKLCNDLSVIMIRLTKLYV
jgi:hypothetical protein